MKKMKGKTFYFLACLASFAICAPAYPSNLDSPLLRYSILQYNLELSWPSISNATGYSVYYAPYPYTGSDSISSFDVGNKTFFSVSLWPYAAFHVAIKAYNQFSESDFSNIIQFVVPETTTYDFESNTYFGLTEYIDISKEHAFQISEEIARAGCYSARFEVRNGDCGYDGDCDGDESIMNRAELGEETFYLSKGVSLYYGFSIRIPDEMTDVEDWRLLTQWHSKPNIDLGEKWSNPILACRYTEGDIIFTGSYDSDSTRVNNQILHRIHNIEKNKWHDFIVHLIWSPNENGLVEIWHQGVLDFKREGQPIGFNHHGEGVYWKFGLYRTEKEPGYTDVVYIDELRRGNSREAVTPIDKECIIVPQIGRPFSPDNPNPKTNGENPVHLNEKSWQRLYVPNETFCQMTYKSDNTIKTKFGQMLSGGNYGFGYIEWFDVERGTGFKTMPSGAPFEVEEVFPEYSFTACHNPGDDSDIWTCKVQISGYN